MTEAYRSTVAGAPVAMQCPVCGMHGIASAYLLWHVIAPSRKRKAKKESKPEKKARRI